MSLPVAMRAAQWSSTTGGVEKSIRVNTIPLPNGSASVPKDSTLVKVSYATLNPVDYKLAETPVIGRFIPRVPGCDFAGTVVGSSHADLKAGDAVFGIIEPPAFGALAEYVMVKGRASVVTLPDTLSPKDGAAFAVSALTAYQSIIPFATRGDKILINGGSGGVGTYGIQIAKAIGCHVTVTCSTPNVELCKSLGADDVIDYRTNDVVESLKRSGNQFALLFDTVGTPSIYYAAHYYLKPSGYFVTIAIDPKSWNSLYTTAMMLLLPSILGGGQRPIKFIVAKADRTAYEQMAQWLKQGELKTQVEKEYTLDQVAGAFAKIKTGRTRGKIIIRVID